MTRNVFFHCLTVAFFALCNGATAHAASLNVTGAGMTPGQPVTLMTGPSQVLTAETSGDGGVSFQNLQYDAGNNLSFLMTFKAGPAMQAVENQMAFDLDPRTGSVEVRGIATRAASIILNVSGQDSKAAVANHHGQFSGIASSSTGIEKGKLKAVASVINVTETCCPRAVIPMIPVTVTIDGVPDRKASVELIESNDSMTLATGLPEKSFAVSVPPALINNSWVKGFYDFSNRFNEFLTAATASFGSFVEAQNNVNAMRAMQAARAATAKQYLASEQLCRYATLSQSLVASGSKINANRIALSDALRGREMGSMNSISSGDSALRSRMRKMRTSYCDPTDTNSGTKRVCDDNNNDDRLNMDVDYTRLADIPWTLDVDFTNSSPTANKDQEDVLALAENLFPSQTLNKTFNDPAYIQSSVGYRSLQAIRGMAKDSFINFIAEKSKGTAGSAKFIKALMAALGLPDASVTSLMGNEPSYFAQMQALTKGLYQDPSFYVNLVESPASVMRQRTAIRAIKLQQQRDFADAVKKREVLLATLLELKLRERSKIVDQRLVNTGQ